MILFKNLKKDFFIPLILLSLFKNDAKYIMNELFKKQVWEISKLIPKGRVSSYGAIAKAVGFPNHSRHVGKAMGGCPKDVPAHRVISSSGTLSVPEFQERLEKEGIEVENLRIKNFKNLFWNPLEEL